MFNNIYKDKVVLVTGHTGFKGSWLSIWLKELGARVVGYSLNPPTEPNNFTASGLEGKLIHILGDVRDYTHLLKVLREHRPEMVFHLAAQPILRLSYEEPQVTFDTNVMGTVNVLEAVRQTKSVSVMVSVTSDKCYDNKEWTWGYRENDPLGGDDPYSASKGCSELVCNAYLRSFFGRKNSEGGCLGAASVRAGNVIGGGDWAKDRLIPDCIRELTTNRGIGVRNPHAMRSWQHVLEPLSGYLWTGALLWGNPQKYSGAWNFGPDDRGYLAVGEIVEGLIHCWGNGSWNNLSNPSAPPEAKLLKLCCDKARAELNWYGTLDICECLKMTAEWYKEFYRGKHEMDMYPFCAAQIQAYRDRAAKKGLVWTQ